jgi:hypothetical protein
LARFEPRPSQLVVTIAVVTPAAAVLSLPPDSADSDGKNEDEGEAAKDEADTKTEGEP